MNRAAAAGLASRAFATLALLLVLAAHLLFIKTYPLNSRGGDTGNYFSMLRDGKSSLVHAGGYPFLIGLPFRHGPLADLPATAPARFERVLQRTQHGIALIGVLVLFAFVRRVYGTIAASLATLGVGTNLQLLGGTSSTYPEWLQSALFVAAASSAGWAYLESRGTRKALLYALSVVSFSWCFLVKFNAAALAIMYVPAFVAERERLTRKLLWLVMYASIAFANIALYELAFHRPTTGTYRLTADTGWVLLTRIQSVYHNQLSPDSGPNTKRWLALSAALPMHYEFAGPGMFSHVNAVPAEIRAPYRPVFDWIMGADDASLDRWLAAHPVPPGFNVGVSGIPVCYYVGLLEGNDLGIKVAGEAVRSDPSTYAAVVWRELLAAMTTNQREALFPVPGNMPAFGFSIFKELPEGRVRLRQTSQPSSVPYAYRNPTVWWPGVRLIAGEYERFVPAGLVTGLAAFAILVAAVGAAVRRRLAFAEVTTLTAAVCLLTVVLASCLTYQFRWKELCLVLPLAATLAGAGLSWAPRELLNLAFRARHASPADSAWAGTRR